jgi:hypothetical protein
MPFTIVGQGGKTKISGHPAFFIDGTIYNDKIQTRFIVWNCEQSGRQFISDCNINKSLGTHQRYLSTQFNITSTIACHGNEVPNSHPELSKHYHCQKFNLSFYTPPLWRTKPFQSKKWFPQGMSANNGSLWTLVTDSQKILYWVATRTRPRTSTAYLRNRILSLKGKTMPSGIGSIDAKITQVALSDTKMSGSQAWGRGRLTTQFEYQKKKYTTEYLFQAVAWNGMKGNLLVCSWAVIKKFWQQPFDLTPQSTTLKQYIRSEVLPALIKN